MTTASFEQQQTPNLAPVWLTTTVSLLVGFAFLTLWFWLLPPLLGFHMATSDLGWRWIFAIPATLGFAVALRCIWDFGHTGRGTPAPIAPPQKLVVVGFYRFVRNPMYVGFFAGWVSLWIIFGRASLAAVVSAGLVLGLVQLFVQFYEEPTLAAKFGPDYTNYCNHVPRWLPRISPWSPPS
jgi:protein-S-isoprenylcysteine O-methyltransferase Ste14